MWFLGENDRNPMMISAVLWFDRRLDVPALIRLLQQRLLARHPVFTQRIVPSANPLLLPRWQDDPDFDLGRHLEVVELPGAGGHRALEAACSRQRSTPLERDRPLWRVHVFQGYRGTGAAMHVRIHHSLGDGLVLMGLLLTLSDEVDPSMVAVADQPPVGFARDLLHRAGSTAARASRLVRHPTTLGAMARRAAVDAAWAARLLAPDLVERTPLLGRPSGTKRMVWDPDGLPLDAVKTVGRAVDATVNDVLLNLLSGALHRYLDEDGEVPDDVLVMVPVDLRTPGAPLPRRLGNRIGLLPVRLPVGLADPVARLAVVRDRTRRLKGSPAPGVSRALLAGTALLTPPLERTVHRVNQLRSTGVVTNVPGPRQTLHVAGAALEGVVGWGGMTGHLNLSGSFISLRDRVFAGIVTDAAITPDPERILEHLYDEWYEVRGRHAA